MELVQNDTTEQAIDFQLVEQYEKDLTKAATDMLTGETGYKAQVYKLLGSEHHLDEGMLAMVRMFSAIEHSYTKEQGKEKNQTLSKLRKAIARFCEDTDTEKLTVKVRKVSDVSDSLMHTDHGEGTVMALVPAKAQAKKQGGEGSEGEGEQESDGDALMATLDSEYQVAVNAFRKDPCLNNKLILDGIMEQMITVSVLAA